MYEYKPIYGDGNPETHPLTWRFKKQYVALTITKHLKVMQESIRYETCWSVRCHQSCNGRGGAGFPAGIKWSLMAPVAHVT